MGKIMRNNLTKKAVAVILTLVLVLTGFGGIGLEKARAASVVAEGDYDDWHWTLDDTGKLTIEAKPGVTQAILNTMPNNYPRVMIPWSSNASDVDTAQIIRTQTREMEIKSNVVLGERVNGLCYGLSSLTTVNASSWDVSRVRSCSNMFGGCSSLVSLDLSSWGNNFRPSTLNALFSGCSNIETINASGWNVSDVEDAVSLFSGCSKLHAITGINNWNTSSFKEIGSMFGNCSSLVELNLSSWDVRNVTDMGGLFAGCQKLTDIQADNWKTSSLKNGMSVFRNCKSFQSFDFINNWDVSKATVLTGVFNGTNVSKINLDKWDTSSVENISYIFYESAFKDITFGNGFKNPSGSNAAVAPRKLFTSTTNPTIVQKDSAFPSGAGHYVVGKEIVFNPNGAPGEKYSQGVAIGVGDVQLKANEFTRDKYAFTGWKTGPAVGISFVDKETVSYDLSKIYDGINLYAQWLYEADDNSDGIKDRLQLFVEYVSNDISQGTVAGEPTEIINANNSSDSSAAVGDFSGLSTSGRSAAPADGYVLDYWSFTPKTGGEKRSTDGVFSVAGEQGASNITITAYFAEDTAGGDATTPGDNIPDKYQVFVKYESENTEKGEITGNTEEVKTAEKDTTTGLYGNTVSFTSSGSEATAKTGYIFSKWESDTSSTNADTAATDGKFSFKDISGGSTIRITAKFVKINYNGDIKDENDNPVTPKTPFDDPTNPTDPSNPNYPNEGDIFEGDDGEEYEITDIGDPDPETGNVPIKVEKVVDENGDGTPDKYQKFTIIYKDTDGSVMETVRDLGVGQDVTAYIPPKPTGKVFSAWTPTFQTTVKAEDAETGTTNIIYTATWKEDRNNDGTADEDQYVTVTYKDGAEGAAFADVVITEVNGVKLIPGDATPAYPNGKPEREYYVFDAWTPSLADVLGDSAATYTATWKDDKNKDNVPDEDQPFTVTFNGNGKEFATNKPADQSVVYGNKATRPTEDPTAEKAIFDNWYKDQACSEAFNFDAEEITAGTTIWAGWFDDLNGDGVPDKDEDKYSIIYQYEDAPPEGAWAPPLLPPSLWNMEITISGSPAPVAGYLFKGWRVTSPADLVVENGKFMMPKSDVTIIGPWVKKNFNDNIKDEDGNDVKPKDPLPSDPEPKEGDRFLDENGDPYEITDVGDTNPDTGETPITVTPVPKNYDDVKDEDGNPVTPKPPFNDDDNKPEDGKKFLDDKGDPYEITEIGETDPKTGDTPITVKPVPKNYDDVKDEDGNPVKPKEPLGKDGEEPEVGDRFEDENGDEYEITEVGPSDKDGNVPVKVGQVMTLTFDLDGGTLAGQTGTFTVKEVKNRSFVIPDEAPTKDGYDFLYWEGSRYDPGDTYVVKDNHKFTAKWKTATVTPKYTDVKDGDGKPVTPKEELTDPKVGDKFKDINGNEYEIVSIGDPDPDTGIATVVVKKVGDKSDSGKSSDKPKAVPTGDESNIALWIVLFVAASLGHIVARRRKRV